MFISKFLKIIDTYIISYTKVVSDENYNMGEEDDVTNLMLIKYMEKSIGSSDSTITNTVLAKFVIYDICDRIFTCFYDQHEGSIEDHMYHSITYLYLLKRIIDEPCFKKVAEQAFEIKLKATELFENMNVYIKSQEIFSENTDDHYKRFDEVCNTPAFTNLNDLANKLKSLLVPFLMPNSQIWKNVDTSTLITKMVPPPQNSTDGIEGSYYSNASEDDVRITELSDLFLHLRSYYIDSNIEGCSLGRDKVNRTILNMNKTVHKHIMSKDGSLFQSKIKEWVNFNEYELLFPLLFQKEQLGGGRTTSIMKKTDLRYEYNGSKRIVYLGKRGGKYIKILGKMVSLSSIKINN